MGQGNMLPKRGKLGSANHMAPIIAFGQAAADVRTARALRTQASEFAKRHGSNAYTDFILRYGQLPDRHQATSIGKLIGKRVKASDGSMQPRPTKAERDALRRERAIRREETQIDDDLSRACDAISFLAQIDSDPTVLISRASLPEAESITFQLEKSVEWLNRFANQWQRYVQNRTVEAEEPPSGDCHRIGAKGLHLIRCSD